ncbi:MAG: cell division protein FtsX [Bdellovibrionales bacterium]
MSRFSSIWKHIRFSWRNHFGVQLATLTVLTATFTVIISLLSLSLNMRNILVHWGESIQITAYLKDDLPIGAASKIEQRLKKMEEFRDIHFISKQDAQESFVDQMAKYSPNLLQDKDIANPFPANFQMDLASRMDYGDLQEIAKTIMSFEGVEDVSYGEDWVQNYAAFVTTFSRSGWFIALMLLIGSLFVVANSVRTSVMHRQDEIKILDLVGATNSMIVTPFIVDGALLGAAASTLAIVISYGIYQWGLNLFETNMAFLALTSHFQYLSWAWFLLAIVAGGASSALSAYWCVKQITTVSSDGEPA